MLAHVHLQKREYDQAISEIEQANLERPCCAGTFAMKASILNYLGSAEKAIDLAKTAIRITPLFPRYYPEVLARAYYGCSRNDEAIAVSNEILKLDPDNIEALLVLAGANIVLDRIKEAQGAIQKLLRVQPAYNVEAFAESHPYRDSNTMDTMIARLEKAGLR